MTLCYSYTRFSTPDQARGDSERRQVEAAREFAALKGWELDETLKDHGVSGRYGKNSKTGALGQFIDLASRGLIESGSILLVEDVDRLTRQGAFSLIGLIHPLLQRGITVVTLHPELHITLQNANDILTMMQLLVYGERGRNESEKKALRVRAAWKNKRDLAGIKPLTSRGPEWLRLKADRSGWDVIEERAEVIRRIYADTVNGVGYHTIARNLNLEKVKPFGRGIKWHDSYVNKLLNSPAVIGVYVPHTLHHTVEGDRFRTAHEPVAAYYPSVVSTEAYQAVKALQQGRSIAPRRGMHAKTAVQSIFGGIALCGRCGNAMQRVNKSNKDKTKPSWIYLACSAARTGKGCKYTAIPYQRLEDAFLFNDVGMLNDAPLGQKAEVFEEKIQHMRGALTAVEEQYYDAVRRQRPDRRSATVTLRALEEERDTMLLELRTLEAERDALAEPLLQLRYADLTVACRKEPLDRTRVNTLMRQVFDSITIYPDDFVMVGEFKAGGFSHSIAYGMPKHVE